MNGTSRTPLPTFEAPGAGRWSLDCGHFPRPATRFTAELFPEPAAAGFREGTGRFGLLLDYIEWAFVNGWAYLCAHPVAALREAGELDRQTWDELARSSPELNRRLATSATVFERKPWRQDLVLWDGQVKPTLIEAHHRLQEIDPGRLGDDELLAHLHRCRENLRRAITVHHRFNVTAVLPVGDLLVHGEDWTGMSTGQLLGVLRSAGPLAVETADELSELAAAVRQHPTAWSALLSPDDPETVLATLRSQPSPVGPAMVSYIDLLGHWSVGSGSDVGDPSMVEMPRMLLETIRAAVADEHSERRAAAAEERAAILRAAVPERHRRQFDELLSEACLVHRVRDERSIYCDVWALGLMRWSILAAGQRLAGRGLVDRPAQLVEASYAEIRSLLQGEGGPAPDELRDRARYRDEAEVEGVPHVLGGPSRSPVPPPWLPAGAARTERAFRSYLAAMSGEAPLAAAGTAVRGLAASPGVYEGRARIVHGSAGLGRIGDGDILVTDATSPAFNVVLPLVGAIVTDTGGMLSHAAIVAREYGIPAVVGSHDATQRIPDGARVRVDGGSGEATVLA